MAKQERAEDERSNLEIFLELFSDVKAGEGATALLLFANIFLILAAYYVLKTVREALTIGGITLGPIEGDEVKTYLSALMALLLVVIVPLYGALASKLSRERLLATTLIFVSACLAGFFVWGRGSGIGTTIGVTFYVWLGIVNVFLIAQFWSFANDVYNEEQGKRLFAVIAIGQSLGAILGPFIASAGAAHTWLLLGGVGVVFMVCLALYTVVSKRETRRMSDSGEAEPEPMKRDGGFELVFKTRYLLFIAAMILVTNVVNTTGEFILANFAKRNAATEAPVSEVLGAEAAATVDAAGGDESALSEEQRSKLKNARGPLIGEFYGKFFGIVNIVGLLIQMLLVSRIFKYLGVRFALFILPVIAFGGYAAIGAFGGLLVLRIAKTAENSTDYSLQNTLKQALFLPTSREAKYKAKAAIDTFFVRFGDAASAVLVAVGLHLLAFNARTFAFVNVVLCIVWVLLSLGIAREHKKLEESGAKPS